VAWITSFERSAAMRDHIVVASPTSVSPTAGSLASRIPVLDGWRGFSILLVLAAHLLPLGPKALDINAAVGAVGISLFFTLSGFLIASFLLEGRSIGTFFIRRLCRILPLAWLYIAMAFTFQIGGMDGDHLLANLLFGGNLPPFFLVPATAHFWSLCVELQFYVGIGLATALVGAARLGPLLVFACFAFTGLRIWSGVPISIVTWFRVDEILAGAVLSVLWHRWPERLQTWRTAPWLTPVLLVLLLLSAMPWSGPLAYLRPYLAALCVATTLPGESNLVKRVLAHRSLRYLAEISFALYVIHPALTFGWLGEGGTVARYAKRPLLMLCLLSLAHLSTFYFERWFINVGRRQAAGRALPTVSVQVP
jgi:peptidoglycan/LPS O-acetylase OafA/YrhL